MTRGVAGAGTRGSPMVLGGKGGVGVWLRMGRLNQTGLVHPIHLPITPEAVGWESAHANIDRAVVRCLLSIDLESIVSKCAVKGAWVG